MTGKLDHGFSCQYYRDDMDRLSTANCGTPTDQNFTFDPFGNVCKTARSGTQFCPNFNLCNQIASVAYDADGDPLNDAVSGAANVYDAEGRATTFAGVGVVYDALSRAVEGGGHEFVYAPDGSKLAVMSGQSLMRADVPLPGGAEAVYTAGGLASYRHAELLGRSRLATTATGALYSAIAFAPYREPILAAGTVDWRGQRITPFVTSGTRMQCEQVALQHSPNPYPVARVSLHQVGDAVDLNHNVPQFATIVAAMERAGLVWGGNFSTQYDPVHFQDEPPGTKPSKAELGACGN